MLGTSYCQKHLNLGFIGAQIRWLRSYGSAHGNVEKPRNQIDIAVKQFKQIVDHPVLIKNACCQSGNSHSLRLDFKILLFFYLVFNGFSSEIAETAVSFFCFSDQRSSGRLALVGRKRR